VLAAQKLEIQAFRVENSLFLEKFSLIRVRKFPVPLRREFTPKLLNSLADGAPKSQRFFSLLAREFAVETRFDPGCIHRHSRNQWSVIRNQ
jgi:hypothetical protein